MHRYRQRATQAVRDRLLLPLRQMTWGEVVVAAAIGAVGGVFPVPLVTSLVTLLTGWYVQCTAAELVVGSTVNLFCTPLQFALLPSFARLMGSLLKEDTSTFTAAALQAALQKGYVAFVKSCGWMVGYAVVAWFLIFLPLVLVLRAFQRCVVQRQLLKAKAHLEVVELTKVEA